MGYKMNYGKYFIDNFRCKDACNWKESGFKILDEQGEKDRYVKSSTLSKKKTFPNFVSGWMFSLPLRLNKQSGHGKSYRTNQ
jgi:hypothetical protein